MRGWEQIECISYRGKLDSCNYTCTYCPFAKKQKASPDPEDELLFNRFCNQMATWPAPNLRIMILPYGEAMIHSYYRQGILRLASLPHITGIGCQTNLSFPVTPFIRAIQQAGIDPSKINLWATFHPGMVNTGQFTGKVSQLKQSGLRVCAGVVGNPEQLPVIRQLRDSLPPDTYLFINAMQGLKQKLTPTERKQFEEIDPLFTYEKGQPATWETCDGGKTSLFVDAAGNSYPCPRSRVKGGNIYKDERIDFTACNRKRCDCYIAYCHQPQHPLQTYMHPNHLWRIPEQKPIRAAFFDIDGTLVTSQGILPESYLKALRWLAAQIPLFLATALPFSFAKKRLGSHLSLFEGGVFADGGHLCYQDKNEYIPVQTPPQLNIPGIHLKQYTAGSITYKYAITTPSSKVTEEIKTRLEHENNYHLFIRERLLTLTAREATKKSGLLHLCNKLSISPTEVLAMGDTLTDWDMLSATGYPCAVPTAETSLLQKATYHITPAHIPLFFKGV